MGGCLISILGYENSFICTSFAYLWAESDRVHFILATDRGVSPVRTLSLISRYSLVIRLEFACMIFYSWIGIELFECFD